MSAPEVGDVAPDFTLQGTNGPVTLSEVIKDHHVVLTTYVFDFTGSETGG